MKILKNRKIAITISVAAAIIATFFGVHRSLNAEAARIETMFYDGVYLADKSYTQPSIGSQLNKRVQSSRLICSIAASYGELDAQSDALRSACDLLDRAGRISEKGDANKRLQVAFDDLYTAFLAVSPNERDSELAQSYADTFYGAQRVIDESRYNDEVYKYANGPEFPASLIKPLVFPDEPDIY